MSAARDVCAGVEGMLPFSYQDILHDYTTSTTPFWLGYPADEDGQCIASLLGHNRKETIVSVSCHLDLRYVSKRISKLC